MPSHPPSVFPLSREQVFPNVGSLDTSAIGHRVPTITADALEDSSNWMDDEERRLRLFGWTDRQVAALWCALNRELAERGISVQLRLTD